MTRSEELVAATLSGDVDRLRECLAAGADPDTRHGGRPVLHLAVLAGSDAAVLALLDAGADANLLDLEGSAALDLALEGAELEEGAFDPEAMAADHTALRPAVIDRLIAVTSVRESPLGDGEWDEDLDVGGIPEVDLPGLSAELAAHYAPAAVAARLTAAGAEEGFRQKLRELAERCGNPLQTAPDGPFFVLAIDPLREAGLLLEDLQNEVALQGILILGGDLDESGRATLVVFPSHDPLEALAFHRTGDLLDELPNGGPGNGTLLEFFRQHPARFSGIFEDEANGRFEKRPTNGWAHAVELCNLCPNAAEAAGGELEGLIEILEKKGEFQLWWD